jgi:hypothetical protein
MMIAPECTLVKPSFKYSPGPDLMRMRTILLLSLIFVIVSLCGRSQAQDTNSGHIVRGENFTLKLPDTWKEIPPGVMASTFKAMEQLAPGVVAANHYDYGYQLASAPAAIIYPYVLVSIKKNGRVPESSVVNLATTGGAIKESANEAADKLKSILSNVRLGQPVYDRQKHALFMNSTMDIKGVGPIKWLTAVCLTEEGSICVYCYATADEFENYFKTFESIVNSVEIANGISYKPRMMDSVPVLGKFDFRHMGRSAMIGAVVGGLAGLIIAISKKKKKVI